MVKSFEDDLYDLFDEYRVGKQDNGDIAFEFESPRDFIRQIISVMSWIPVADRLPEPDELNEDGSDVTYVVRYVIPQDDPEAKPYYHYRNTYRVTRDGRPRWSAANLERKATHWLRIEDV